jgi:hypothetical protein
MRGVGLGMGKRLLYESRTYGAGSSAAHVSALFEVVQSSLKPIARTTSFGSRLRLRTAMLPVECASSWKQGLQEQ